MMRRMACAVAVVVSLPCAAAFAQAARDAAPGWGVQQLMLALRQVKTATGHFVERKSLHMMKTPLEASGTLFYLAPDQLQKVTNQPKWERLAVNRDMLTIDQGGDGRTRTLPLSDYPEIGAFIESIRATLAGDLPALTRFYAVTVDGTEADWHLMLVPKEPRLQRLVKWIRIGGSGHTVRTMETEEADGDRSDMSITDADVR